MSSVHASAPGKAVLFGDYAVLEGAPAVSLAVNRRARVQLVPAARWQVQSPHLGLAAEFDFDAEGLPRWRDADAARAFALVDAVLRGLVQQGLAFARAEPFQLSLDTAAFHLARNAHAVPRKLGLGSSAALCVALATALSAHLLPHASAPALDLLLPLHRRLQDGRGSGVDVATSRHGGLIAFQRQGEHTAVHALAWPRGLHALFVAAPDSASTADYLARLERWAAREPADYRARMEALAELARSADEAFRRGEVSRLIALARDYSTSLAALGAAAGLDIVSAAHRAIAELARDCGAVYKSCGAGGGDLGVALADDPAALQALRQRLHGSAFTALDLHLDARGLEVELRDAHEVSEPNPTLTVETP